MKKLWCIRHIRWAWHSWRFNVWWRTQGRFLGVVPNDSDLEYLEAVRHGRA